MPQHVARDVVRGAKRAGDPASALRWAGDVILDRALAVAPLPRLNTTRTVRIDGGVSLRYRLNRGDIQSVREVWLEETYRVPMPLDRVAVVVDLGANIGLTSVYLATRHRPEWVLAVEPVAANARLARRNLAANGVRGEVLEAAVAAEDGFVDFQEAADSNVGRSVSGDGSRRVPAVTMATLLQRLGDDARIDLVKVDVEGAEAELFSGDLDWLRRVRCLMVEFHPDRVDYPGLVQTLESAGFDYIPAGSVHPCSADTFVRR